MTEWIDGVVKYSETELKLLGFDQTVRYPYIYKAQDGKYYNDRAAIFKKSYDDPMYECIYQGQNSSKCEITLPYVLRDETFIIP